MNDPIPFPDDLEEARAEMKRAVRYRSGPNDIGSVYLGGMASAGIMGCLGARYGDDSMQDAIDAATPKQLIAAWEDSGFQWILGHYRAGGSKLYRFETRRIETD